MASAEETIKELEVLIRARYPLIYLRTYEEERVEQIVARIGKERDKVVYCWSISRGIYPQGAPLQSKKAKDQATSEPGPALDAVLDSMENAIYIFKDFHPFMNDPVIVRKLREVAHALKASYKTLVLISPEIKIPVELEKDLTVVDFPLPGYEELETLLDQTIKEVNEHTEIKIDPTRIPKELIVKAALGLTLSEAENVFAKTLVMGGRLDAKDIPTILSEKEQIIRKSGMLEYYSAREKFSEIGGLDLLKDWLKKRSLAFSEKAKRFGLPYPKGILLLGVQGCGKSLCAKAVSQLWRLPLLRFDVGRVFSSLVGSSEENMRRAVRIAESVAPAILWIDEIDKAFSGIESSGMADGGTTSRVLGYFITWLQEKTSPVFVIATANNIKHLPPELMRKGRLDEIFFVDLPNARERQEIIRIHLIKRGRDPANFDLEALSRASAGFSGAEIEQGIISALFDVFEKGQELNNLAIETAFKATVPLSKTMKEDIDRIREWCETRARKASLDEKEEGIGGRRVEL